MRVSLLSAVIISFCVQAYAQTSVRCTVSGFVREAGSGESLIGVNIYQPESRTGTVTNNFGFFSPDLSFYDYFTDTLSCLIHEIFSTGFFMSLHPRSSPA